MMNKKKVEETLLALAVHMQQCTTCVESLLSAGDSKADPPCDEYRQLKAVAKAWAGR